MTYYSLYEKEYMEWKIYKCLPNSSLAKMLKHGYKKKEHADNKVKELNSNEGTWV